MKEHKGPIDLKSLSSKSIETLTNELHKSLVILNLQALKVFIRINFIIISLYYI